MKNITLSLLATILCIFTANHSFAAFPLKNTAPVAHSTVVTKNEGTHESKLIHILRSPERLVDRIKTLTHFNEWTQQKTKPGYPGIVSLICGILAWINPYTFIPLSIAALVFGIIGVGRHYKNHGLAIAGLILGALEVLLLIVAVIFVAAFITTL